MRLIPKSQISNLKSIEVIYVSLQDRVTLRNPTPVNQIQALHQQAMDLNVVVSEDGYVNMVPTLRHQIKKQDIEHHVELLKTLTSENYHSTRSWLDKHRFYLTSEQCDVVNTELTRIKDEPQEVGEIRFITPVFNPDPEMNESYYLDEFSQE